MSKIISISITTTEQAVTLNATYQYVWLRNMGENDCLLSNHSGIVAGGDDVMTVKAGESGRISTSGRAVYVKAVSGTSTGEIHAQNFSDAPFKELAKGGESGGFTRTVLYDSGGYDRYAPFQTDVPLLDNLSNYDFILLCVGTDGDNARLGKYECDSAVFDVQLILRNDYNAHYAGYSTRWLDIHFTDTTFNIMNSDTPSESSSLKPCVYFLFGYKF